MSKPRRGRPRKTGNRYPCGRLKPASPKEIAAAMPHRRGLGENASSQLAVTELGRMGLRGVIPEIFVTAGETYARLWRGYLSTLGGPQTSHGGLGRFVCTGCPTAVERAHCACERRKRVYWDATKELFVVGGGAVLMVRLVVLDDEPCPLKGMQALWFGLDALAEYFGLTNQRNRNYQYASPRLTPPADA